ncbi:hypothetical protein [Haliangium sp.]|uniref:hypothetical protein n=1 Tax=Haliangium sp. TaxID=2663208 RepID=UPI003D14D751
MMSPLCPARAPRRHTLLVALAVAAGLGVSADPTQARPRTKGSYCFLVAQVEAGEGVPAALAAEVRERLVAAVEAHPRLLATLPEGAPDPQAAPKAFAKFMKKRGLASYRVNVEITGYRHELAPAPKGQTLTVHVALRTWGETMPKPTVAFAGKGSATVGVQIGRRLRERDTEVANKDAAEAAIAQALGESIAKLDATGTASGGKRRKKN